MTTLIVSGHGHFATGLQSALEQIIGQYPKVAFFDFDDKQITPEQLRQNIEQYLNAEQESAVLFCCDILGGTPFRQCAMIAQQFEHAEVIVGTNLQMLIETIMAKDELEFADLVTQALASANQGITTLSAQQKTKRTARVEDDGI
ncbi:MULTISPECIES: PTS galactosamine/N-acetylgalactosamine transporter subunit IIA [Avibacterium]|uniref:PTS galactosamine/N-acetylgalactosamine transporter subunit IIA n=1 Tax=Avibacterium paragallinarum TaxID=728 RepID=A0ABU7QPF8_AVIPA|nr:PTS galactosamine/N-acetylgalactosamine transporter subunit IIA [Avibacterium paragallinarum]